MTVIRTMALAAIALSGIAATAGAAVTVTQGASAPAYTTTLTFDEPGGPSGANVPANSWAGAPWSIPSIVSGEGSNLVGSLPAATGQSTNVYYGPYGVFIQFGQDLSELSFNAWDTSGPPTFSGGGMAIVLINNGDEMNPVAFEIFTPAYAGFGDSAFNITTSGGTVFDEVRIVGFGFFPETMVDNLSWNAVPAPSTAALFCLVGMTASRRRRA